MLKRLTIIGSGLQEAVSQSIKNERLKTELITNVSHDIKTPLTSIVNYVGLLKREKIEDPKVKELYRYSGHQIPEAETADGGFGGGIQNQHRQCGAGVHKAGL